MENCTITPEDKDATRKAKEKEKAAAAEKAAAEKPAAKEKKK